MSMLGSLTLTNVDNGEDVDNRKGYSCLGLGGLGLSLYLSLNFAMNIKLS